MSAEKPSLLQEEKLINEDDDVWMTEPFLNHDVIRHLCKFLDLKDIKTCRLVSPCWNYGSTPVLKARTFIDVHLKSCRKNKDNRAGGLRVTWNILEIVEKLKFSPDNIHLEIQSNSVKTPGLSDFSVFPQVNTFKSISALLGWHRWINELAAKFVQSSSTTLKKLVLDMNGPIDLPSFGGTVFPKLTKLSINHDFFKGSVKRIRQAFTTSFPNLEDVEAPCSYLVAILKKEAGLLANWQPPLSCLQLSEKLTTNGMKCLSKIPAGLKKLDFGKVDHIRLKIDDRVAELETFFYKFLKKQAPTLETLKIGMDIVGKWETFPIFPVLKKLSIDYTSIEMRAVFETSQESGHFGGINYAVGFPVLEVLNYGTWQADEDWLEAFLPSNVNRQVVQSVKKVRFIVLPEGEGLTAISERVSDMFPNARGSLRIRDQY